MRLIDADALEKKLCAYYKPRENEPYGGLSADAIAAMAALDAAPTVVPLRHGRWLTWEEQFPDRKPTKNNRLGVFCTECHLHADCMCDYCPNCGARMDGASSVGASAAMRDGSGEEEEAGMPEWFESQVCMTCDVCGKTATASMTKEAFVQKQRDKGWTVSANGKRTVCPDCRETREIERRTGLPTTEVER